MITGRPASRPPFLALLGVLLAVPMVMGRRKLPVSKVLEGAAAVVVPIGDAVVFAQGGKAARRRRAARRARPPRRGAAQLGRPRGLVGRHGVVPALPKRLYQLIKLIHPPRPGPFPRSGVLRKLLHVLLVAFR